ncbi:hypothetical protein CYG49_04695 [Candidatus Saccharibacteria bacterium]|nr:MAG: hypothetical protein CYG49_04695 [Candidatus Saccharibacteria bacterium]
MEPQLPAPRPSHEMGSISRGGEVAPAPAVNGGEVVPQRQPEQAPQQVEQRETAPQAGVGDPAFAAPQAPPPLPPAITPQPQDITDPTPVDDNPIVAADEDLIEKEWVERAKKIVASTKDDPYLQEKEVSKLQADYLKKRYGKEVKLTTD